MTILMAMLLAAACASPAPSGSVTPAGPSGTMTVATDVPLSLDPGWATSGNHIVLKSLVGVLAIYPQSADPKLIQGPQDVKAELAESWTRDSDSIYTFKLRDTQSSFGNPLTSEDVKWTWERGLANDPIKVRMAGSVNISPKVPIKVIDSKTFQLLLDAPSCCFLANLPFFHFGVLDSVEAKKHATAADPWANEWVKLNAPSFGPYKVASFTPGESLVLEANPNYWQASKGFPSIKTVRFRTVADAATRATLISSGEVDWVTSVPYDRLPDLSKNPNLKVDTAPTLRALNIFMDQRSAPFNNVNVRRAVSLAINREAVAQSAFHGFATPSRFVSTDRIPGPRPAAGSEYMKFDQAGAKRLLETAGLPNGFTFKLYYNNGDATAAETGRAVQLMQQQLAAVGIKVELNPVAPAEFSRGTAALSYAAWMTSAGPLVADASYDAKGRYYAVTSTNAPGFTDPALNKAIDQAATSFTNREAALTEIYSILGQLLPAILIVDIPNAWVFNKRVSGQFTSPSTQAVHLEYLKLAN